MTDSGWDNRTRQPLTASAWDAAIDRLDGDLLQRWSWGEFKSRYGWTVERVESSTASRAQILFRHVGPLSLAYIPRGPVFSGDADDDLELLHEIDAACARKRAISLIVEPVRPLPKAWSGYGAGFTPAEHSIQSPRTVIVDLTLDDDALLQGMRKDTRYNISWAQRHGVAVEHVAPSNEAIDQFFALLSDTATRNEFGIHVGNSVQQTCSQIPLKG